MLIPNTIFRMGSGAAQLPGTADALGAAAVRHRILRRPATAATLSSPVGRAPRSSPPAAITRRPAPPPPPAAAILLTNKASEARRAKYRLEHVVRVHLGADDTAYK